MRLRLGAAVLVAAILPLTAVTIQQPASAGVDTTPPAVGSCHDLTLREGYRASDPDPAVACSARHTSHTFKVVEFEDPPPWRDEKVLQKIVRRQCVPAVRGALGGNAKAVQLSATSAPWWFMPTPAQRDAGAAWIRCDLVNLGGDRLMPLPADPTLSLPLSDSRAKCRVGKRAHYLVTTCSRPHQYRATHAVKYPSARYPGDRRLQRWSVRKCGDKLGRSFGYYEWPGRLDWKLGFSYSICFKTTRR